MDTAAAQLRRFPILAELSDEELEKLSGAVCEVRLERGEYLFREGDRGDSVYFIEEGVVVAERVIDPAAGAHKDLAILAPLTPVGELALAEPNQPRSASVRVEVSGRARRLDLADFHRLGQEMPSLASKLFRSLFGEASRRLRTTNDELVAIYEVAQLVAAAEPPATLAAAVLTTLAGRLAATRVLVARYSAKHNALGVVHALGADARALLGSTIPLDGGLAARAYDDRKALLIDQMLGATEPWESASMIVSPLIVGAAADGVLVLGRGADATPFRIDQMSLVAAVANISSRIFADAFPADA